jgi:serine/threonine protein kinase
VQADTLAKLRIRWSDVMVGKPIGTGGFGTVYEGRWQGNRVAIKQLDGTLLSLEARAALNHEAAVMCELRHPCIAVGYGERLGRHMDWRAHRTVC